MFLKCRAINESGVCPSIEFINTENVVINIDGSLAEDDPKNKLKVDASGMSKVPAPKKAPNIEQAPQAKTSKPKTDKTSSRIVPDWTRMRVTAEFKVEEEDPVVDQPEGMTDAERKLEV